MSGPPSVIYLLALLDAFLDYLVEASLEFTQADGQWVLAHCHSSLTDKGVSMMDALVTIMCNGLVFLAQVATLLPAQAGA